MLRRLVEVLMTFILRIIFVQSVISFTCSMCGYPLNICILCCILYKLVLSYTASNTDWGRSYKFYLVMFYSALQKRVTKSIYNLGSVSPYLYNFIRSPTCLKSGSTFQKNNKKLNKWNLIYKGKLTKLIKRRRKQRDKKRNY